MVLMVERKGQQTVCSAMAALLSMPPQLQRTGEVLCGSATAAMKNVWRQTVAYVEIAISKPTSFPPRPLRWRNRRLHRLCCQDSGGRLGRSPGGPPCQVIERCPFKSRSLLRVAGAVPSMLETGRQAHSAKPEPQAAGSGQAIEIQAESPSRHCENGIRYLGGAQYEGIVNSMVIQADEQCHVRAIEHFVSRIQVPGRFKSRGDEVSPALAA